MQVGVIVVLLERFELAQPSRDVADRSHGSTLGKEGGDGISCVRLWAFAWVYGQ
jgi:hypothetical protein